MSSNPPVSIATTTLSKEIPRSVLTVSFFSGLQRNGFTGPVYAAVCLLSPCRTSVVFKTPNVLAQGREPLCDEASRWSGKLGHGLADKRETLGMPDGLNRQVDVQFRPVKMIR